MKQKLKRFMAGFMAMLTLVGTLFTNGTTAFAASPQANIAFWNASVKNSGEVSELKPGYNHGKILYSILDGNSAYCMNFGLRADGGQLMNSYDDASTSMSAQQRKLLSYCLYYGFNSTQKAAPSNSQCDEYIATQAMVWVIVADIFGTGSGDSAARKLCNTAPSPDSSYSYYERLRDNISSSYNATLPSFASRRTSEAPTYELKWNEGSQRFETTLSDSNGVLSDFDFGISGYSVDKNGNSITISSTSVNTTATTGTFTSNAGKVETTSSCVFWLTGKSGYQEFISERPTADPVKAYIKVKTENIGYGELTKTDESSGVKLSGAVYGIYSDSGCTNRVQTMTTDGNGYAKSAALVAGTYYVKEITAPKGYVLSGTVHTLTVKAGQTTGISATDKEQLGAITIYKEGEVLSSWNGSNFTYEKKKLSGAAFKVTAGADIYKADNEWNVILLRYFNPIGAHPSGTMGENPNGIPNNLMPYITQVAVGKLKELGVFGNDYDTPDGTGVRDYIHVVDLANGHVKALKKIEENAGLCIYNLGTGHGYSVLDIVKNFEEANGIKIPYSIKPRRPGDIATCYCDPGKAERELGWKAQYGIKEMCADSWRWQKNNPNGYED